MRLAGKVAIITGSGSGIGRAAALKFAQEGARVLVAERNPQSGEETAALIVSAGGEALFQHTDVSVYEQVVAAVDRAADTWGRLDVLVNNAATGVFKPLLDYEPADFDRVVKVNQSGTFYGILAAGRKMRDFGNGGTIINVASVFGFVASKKIFGYHATKGAVRMMTQSAALELARYNIRVVAVAPGSVDTPFIQPYKDSGQAEAMAKLQMRGELMKPEHIANVMAFLASEEADGINGSTVMVDDGFASFK